jgi:Mannosyltransferase (PIG-V)
MRRERSGAEASRDHPSSERIRIRAGIWYCVKVFLALRVGLFVVAILATALLPSHRDVPQGLPGPVSVPGWPAHEITPGLHNLFTAWERFDALWFLRIATTGYASGDGSAAFFPLYPLAVRAVSFLIGGHPFAASLIVSNAAFLGGLIVLFFLTSSEVSPGAARRTVLYISIFPTAFFFLAPYSESLFLLLSVSSFWAARRRKWPVAGVLGALAAATRVFGLLLVPALAIEALHQWRRARLIRENRSPGDGDGTRDAGDARRVEREASGRTLAARLGWAVSASLGLVAYLAYWQAAFGNFRTPLRIQENWERVAVAPWSAVIEGTKDAFGYLGQYPQGYHQLDWLVGVPALALGGYVFLRFRPAYGFYTCASLLIPLSFVFQGRPLMSLPRLVLPLFPIFWALARLAERRRLAHDLIVAASAVGLGIMTILFVDWLYVF